MLTSALSEKVIYIRILRYDIDMLIRLTKPGYDNFVLVNAIHDFADVPTLGIPASRRQKSVS